MPHFGKRVIGDAVYAEQVKKELGGGSRFGPRVVGAPRAAAEPSAPPEKPEKPAAAGISIAELKAALAENPLLAEPFYEQELARPEGARVGALRVLRDAFTSPEHGDDGAPTIAEIDELLAAKAQAAKAKG